MNQTNAIRRLILPGMAIGLGVFYVGLEPDPRVDELFTNGWSKWILTKIAALTDLVPFSVAELFLGLTLLGLFFGGIHFLLALLKGQGRLQALFAVTDQVAVLFMAFLLIWGFNYRSMGLSTMLQLTPRQGTAQELKALALGLTRQAATERSGAGFSEAELFDYSGDLQAAAGAAYQKLALIYPQTGSPVGRVKPLMSSQLFSRLGISGIFIPFTAEANYNAHQPMLLIPSSALHELAHLKGIAREEEASFMAYLASRSSADFAMRYSATMMALFSTLNQLAKVDAQSVREVRLEYSEGMKLDLKFYRDYWNGFAGGLQDRADDMNDLYLRSNGQSDGIDSYGNMVSYLLAWKEVNQ